MHFMNSATANSVIPANEVLFCHYQLQGRASTSQIFLEIKISLQIFKVGFSRYFPKIIIIINLSEIIKKRIIHRELFRLIALK